MADYTSDEWEVVVTRLTRHYGQDIAQEAICKVLGAIERGATVNDLYIYTLQTVKHLIIQENKTRTKAGLVSLNQLIAYTDKAGLPMIEGLIDYNDPETQLIKQEQAAAIAHVKEAYQEQIEKSLSKRMQSHYRKLYKRAVKEVA